MGFRSFGLLNYTLPGRSLHYRRSVALPQLDFEIWRLNVFPLYEQRRNTRQIPSSKSLERSIATDGRNRYEAISEFSYFANTVKRLDQANYML